MSLSADAPCKMFELELLAAYVDAGDNSWKAEVATKTSR